MLLWQPQKYLPNIRRIVGFSLFFHLIVCFCLLFVYKDYHQRLVIDLSQRIPSQAVVRMLPLGAARSTPKKGANGVTLQPKSGSVSAQQSAKKTKVAKKASTSVVKNAAGIRKKTTQGKLQKNKKEIQKKKKPGEKKVVKKEAETNTKQEMQSVQKVVQEEQKTEKKSSPCVQSTQEPEKLPAVVTEPQASAGSQQEQEILYLTRQELDALQIQQKLHDSLFAVWEAPAGMSKDMLCEMLVTVGWDGKILATQCVQKTGILLYDVSVQEAVEQVLFPHEVWGKQITIAFKP